jgi:hypothetical protein
MQLEEARKAWADWDATPDRVKKLLGEDAMPKMPRPNDE